MKIAICVNERNGMYRSYYYNWSFRIFGADMCDIITSECTEERCIRETQRMLKLDKGIKLIRIMEMEGK